jgi:hypothetical protein
MAELVDHGLPLNRKERFYTATVLPMLVCADDFAHLDRLLAMAGLTDILSNSAGSGVQVFSEYGYWESIHPLPDTDPDAPATRDTPDLVLFLLGPSRRLLVLIEAKLYHRPSRAALGEQLSAQAGLLTHLADRLQVPPDGRAQLVLLPEQRTGELGLVRGEPSPPDWPRVIVRTWQELLQAYRPVAPAYWVDVLALALDRYPQLRSKRPAPGANAWALVTGAELLAGCRQRS